MSEKEVRKRKDIRIFGLMSGIAVLVIFEVFPLLKGRTANLWPLITALVIFTVAFVKPAILKPLYAAWIKIAGILGWINTRIALGLLYYAVFFPLGYLKRMIRKDPLEREYDINVVTYRKASKQAVPENMEVPF